MKGEKAIKKIRSKKKLKARKEKISMVRKRTKAILKRNAGKKSLVKTKASSRRKVRPRSNRIRRKVAVKRPAARKIVRLTGRGQFTVDQGMLKELNRIDNSIVELISRDIVDEEEFRKRLSELTDVILRRGKPLDPKEIVPSDIMLPSSDLSLEEAKRIFKGEGAIPETFA